MKCMQQVTEIRVDENLYPKQWKMSWCSAYALNGVADNIEFQAIGQTEWLDVDMNTVVAYTNKLAKGKRNPRLFRLGNEILKRVRKVLSLAQVAEENGDLVCAVCNADNNESSLECPGCSRWFHGGCAEGWDEEAGVQWWCPDCISRDDSSEDDWLDSMNPA